MSPPNLGCLVGVSGTKPAADPSWQHYSTKCLKLDLHSVLPRVDIMDSYGNDWRTGEEIDSLFKNSRRGNSRELFAAPVMNLCVCVPSAAVYMSELERTKAKTPKCAEKSEEGAAEAAAPASQEGQSTSEGESSSQWPPATVGVTYELCAGLVDKPELSLEEIARQEVLEECGYDVPASKLKRITSYR